MNTYKILCVCIRAQSHPSFDVISKGLGDTSTLSSQKILQIRLYMSAGDIHQRQQHIQPFFHFLLYLCALPQALANYAQNIVQKEESLQ